MRIPKTVRDLSTAQVRALRGLDMMRSSGGVDLATMRANGHRRDVIDRLCEFGLAFCAGDHGNSDRTRFDLTQRGREWADEAAEQES